MSLGSLIVIAASVVAAFGGAELLATATNKDPAQRERRLRRATYGLTLGGLLLMIGSIVGWCGNDALFGGLMMLTLGTGIEVAPAERSAPAAQQQTRA